MKIMHTPLLVLGLVFTLGGCQGEQDIPEETSLAETVSQNEASTPELSKVAESRAFDTNNKAKIAIRDLAERLDVPAKEIKVIRVESVTWRDGSLGCPKPGMMYTQALVPGTLIVLRVDNAEYEYHSGGGRAPFYCENPVGPAPKSSAD